MSSSEHNMTQCKQTVEELFQQWKKTGDPKIREQIILCHQDLVHNLARRFKDRGEPYEDLVQQGMIGLINAVDRFDPDRGVKFMTYAVPTIIGEIKRYFRDKGWTMRVPRRMQELNLKAYRIMDELTQRLGRAPTVRETASELGVSEEELLEALDIAQAYAPVSLESESIYSNEEDQHQSVLSRLADEQEMARFSLQTQIQEAMQVLDDRERKIVQLSFFDGCSQTEIAKALGISQMHVSRLLRKALQKMRAYMS